MSKEKIINIISLGCSKNLVDSEKLMAQLKAQGYRVVFDSNDTSAKIVIINTCGFIADAKEESLDTILSFAYAKKENKIEKLYVVGCLSERYKKDLEQEIPEVDQFFGVNDIYEVLKSIGGEFKTELLGDRVLTTPNHYAYLKISEGCNWHCSYCAIPLIRGEHKSVKIEDLVNETTKLAQKGVKEIMLIAQDLTYYGLDLYKKRALSDLLKELVKVDGIQWIRLHYAYPQFFPKDVIDVMKNEPKICKYIDIPFQHISTSVLSSMKRGITKEETIDLIKYFRENIPEIAIRTTLIAGYPTETQKEFDELVDFIKETKFERLGVFAYCHEEDTPAGETLEDIVSEKLKNQRMNQLMLIQNDIALQNNKKHIGKKLKCIIDRYESDFYIGRSQYDSPEVDGEIIIKSDYDLIIGDFYDILITKAEEYDLYGEA